MFMTVSPKNPSPLSSYPPFRPRSCSPPLPPGSDESSTLGIKHDMHMQERRRSKVQSTPVPIHRVDSTSTSSSTASGHTYSTTPHPQTHSLARARPRHPNSIPSPSSSTQLDGPLHLDLDVDALPSPSVRRVRGNYPHPTLWPDHTPSPCSLPACLMRTRDILWIRRLPFR
jgi:hypothetical protein